MIFAVFPRGLNQWSRFATASGSLTPREFPAASSAPASSSEASSRLIPSEWVESWGQDAGRWALSIAMSSLIKNVCRMSRLPASLPKFPRGGDRNSWRHRHDRVNRENWKRRGDRPGTRSHPDGTSPSGTAPWLVSTGVIGCDQLYEMEMRAGIPQSLGIRVNGQRSGHSSNRSRNLRNCLEYICGSWQLSLMQELQNSHVSRLTLDQP